ncbi:MAG: guanylate kinase [Duncaniella sp.]|nr:guanylate kinase [Muribaculum sp.]MCM1254936.1 guanylate kinase [Duncaniella sp.]
MEGKIIIISAPSGCGKSTIISALLQRGEIDMQFSISATNRPPRQGEEDGVSYYFLTNEEFHKRIAENAFVEYEEVYPGRFYGTLKSEISRITGDGHNVILDIDVKGGVNVKKMFGTKAISIFIEPPSVDALRERLIKRATDPTDAIEQRVSKAEYEISFAPEFDVTVVNDDLEEAVTNVDNVIKKFLSGSTASKQL